MAIFRAESTARPELQKNTRFKSSGATAAMRLARRKLSGLASGNAGM